jgi:hypothetical protein
MSVILLASSFLAGSLLSLLIPILLLMALVFWYMRVVRRAEAPGRPVEQTQVPVPPQPPASAGEVPDPPG